MSMIKPILIFVTATFALATPALAQNARPPQPQQQPPMGAPNTTPPPPTGAPNTTPPQTEPIQPEEQCPHFVRGSKLAVSDVDRGVSVRLTSAQSANVPQLRDMAREFQRVMEQQIEQQAAGSASGSAQGRIPPLDISVKDVAGGAVVTVRAEHSEDVGRVRKQAREVESFWKSSACITGKPTPASR
jgi:hypothetical protein